MDAFTNPQFYAEDGHVWFSDAYNMGPWHALWSVYNGHLLIQPRLVAIFALPFGTSSAPLIYNLFGLLFQIAPVLFLMSSRFAGRFPSLWGRVALSAVYLLMPSTELHVTDACAQFHLAILTTLVLVAPPPRRWWWGMFDAVTVILCAMTGSFVFVLLPVALFWWWRSRHRWVGVLSALLAVGFVAQGYAQVLAPRNPSSLGATVQGLLQIVADRIVLAASFAEEGHAHVYVAGRSFATLIAGVVCVFALCTCGFALLRAPWELRIFLVVAVAFAAAGLAVPLVTSTGNQWPVILMTRSAERYFLMAQVAWVVTLLWAISRLRASWLRRGAWAAAGAVFATGLVANWTYPAFPDDHWAQEAQLINTSPAGTYLELPIPPAAWVVAVTVK
jgi:hypothetical protein